MQYLTPEEEGFFFWLTDQGPQGVTPKLVEEMEVACQIEDRDKRSAAQREIITRMLDIGMRAQGF